MATGFPPEPNGHLRIGPRQVDCLNFGVAEETGETCGKRWFGARQTGHKVSSAGAMRSRWYTRSVARDQQETGPDADAIHFTEVIARSGLPVVAAYLFGSAARLEAGPLSDVDVAVLFDEATHPDVCIAAAARLHTLLGQGSARPVQIVVLNWASPLLRHRVLRDGVVLVGREDARRVRFEEFALCEYLDFLPILDRLDRALIARARAGRLGA